MATDAAGLTISTGDQYLLGGVVRKISGSEVVVVVGGGQAVHCTDADLLSVVTASEVPFDFQNEATGTGLTGLFFRAGDVPDRPSFGIAMRSAWDITLDRVVVTSEHNDSTSPPLTGVLNVVKNTNALSSTASFTFNWNASAGVEEGTAGHLSSPIDIDAGSDYFWCYCTFSAIDDPAARVRLMGSRR